MELQVAAGRFSFAAAAAAAWPKCWDAKALLLMLMRGFYNRISVLLQAGVRGVLGPPHETGLQ